MREKERRDTWVFSSIDSMRASPLNRYLLDDLDDGEGEVDLTGEHRVKSINERRDLIRSS